MFRNFFTVALRNFLRQRFYSLLNVFGLASGLMCALFIYLWVNDEVRTDKFHQDSENIFRIVSNLDIPGADVITWNITPGPLAEDIRDHIPEVELAVRTLETGPQLFQHGDKSFYENGIYADADFFRLFSFPIVSGRPSSDSVDISHISISRKVAEKLFGQENAIGKAIRVNQANDYIVNAVFENVAQQSSIRFDYVLPFEVYKRKRGDGFNWGNFDHPLYVKLNDPRSAPIAIKKINERRDAIAKAANDSDNVSFFIQPFTDAYLHGHFENGQPAGGRIEYIRIFSVVAVFILIIACINFMNMATARAGTRSKEVGIRKVVGAQRNSLILQFIGESIFLSAAAMLIAIGIVYTTLPIFNMLVDKQIVIELTNTNFILAVLSITLTTGLLAGCYPAMFLSSYRPAQVLKGTLHTGSGGSALRKGLVVFQFALTVILVASALVIYDQISFIMKKNLGYEKGSVLSFSAPASLLKAFDTFREDAIQHAEILQISRANESLIQVGNQNSSVNWAGKPDNSQEFFRTVIVDYGFMETMGLKLEDGRYFSKQFNDTNNFILTKRAIEVMGLANPVGENISQWGVEGKVVGVVDDIHTRSMQEAIDPVVFMCKPEWTRNVFVRFESSSAQEAITTLQSVFKKYSPEYPFAYTFLQDDFERLYNNEKVTGSLAVGFTLMAVIISGLGLLGLAAYTSERRKKEISIRKTLGASVSGIVVMMSGDFAKLSLIAICIGCPIAWLAMEKFLEGYAYHTPLGWEIFVLTSVVIMAISLVTVIFQVTKAAMANPVDSLRTE